MTLPGYLFLSVTLKVLSWALLFLAFCHFGSAVDRGGRSLAITCWCGLAGILLKIGLLVAIGGIPRDPAFARWYDAHTLDVAIATSLAGMAVGWLLFTWVRIRFPAPDRDPLSRLMKEAER